MADSRYTVILRADARPHLGTGHIMRMIALAQAIQDRGGIPIIVSVECPLSLRDHVKASGIQLHYIEGGKPGDDKDLEKTLAVATSEYPEANWIVLDGYHFGIEYQGKLAAAGLKVLCVDDYGHCKVWACHALLNQNLGAEKHPRESAITPFNQFLGAKFVLLRREFRERIPEARSSGAGSIKRLLISMGGMDACNATGRILDLLEQIHEQSLSIRILAWGANPHLASLQARESRHQLEVKVGVKDMPSEYEWADGIISAGGSTCWEWLFFGLPGCVVTIADNQVPIVEELSSRGMALSLGWYHQLNESSVEPLKQWLSRETDNILDSSESRPVDGHGAVRVAAALEGVFDLTFATAAGTWMNEYLLPFIQYLRDAGHRVNLVHHADQIPASDIVFLLSFEDIVKKRVLARNPHNLVVHASRLPEGRGWSPLTWQILEGKNDIPITLFEAAATVDSGEVYFTGEIQLDGHELIDETRAILAAEILRLCKTFIEAYPNCINGKPQVGEATFYQRRQSEDSQLDLDKPLREQINLFRVVDNERYPAFFDYLGHRFELHIFKKR